MSARPKYDIAAFHDHEVQWLIALFCTKRELYKDYQKNRYKQDYFFGKFRYFAAKYYNFSGDESVYFNTVRKEAAGEANMCGGGDIRSGASARYFKNRYRGIEESREKQIDEFSKKYGVSFEPSKPDPRRFLGVADIWNKLDMVDEILAASKWAYVREMSYDDEHFATPFPPKLEKELVPFVIRNKTMQKYRASQCKLTTKITFRQTDIDEYESEPSVSLSVVPFPKMVSSKIFVMSEEFNENDW